MKALNFKAAGDSELFTCLLSHLHGFGFSLHKAVKIRNNIFYIELNGRRRFILKGFPKEKKLLLQARLTALLKDKGFLKTYSINMDLPPFEIGGRYYAFIEYLMPHPNPFFFSEKSERKEGLQLLEQFHLASSQLTRELQDDLATFDQAGKWAERSRQFQKNLTIVRTYVSDSVLEQWQRWADWSLEGLIKNKNWLSCEENAIIHGDVAHHNFLRKNTGELFLIDFDLISIAPPLIDYLQYANRILPYIQEPDKIWEYPQLERYKRNPAFLFALAYPADIFREWNRVAKENLEAGQPHLHTVWKMTVEQFNKRMQFNRYVERLIMSGYLNPQ
ncbi:phosphotransferase [Bacillus sp. M6-12]|uniref:phosphotransferase n=1 Tax=Bacillus sp. M6-12 TaxID=2054166 RepID=UPI0015E10309|nr:phosphotransferase [Bacillus sp. M6-12]